MKLRLIVVGAVLLCTGLALAIVPQQKGISSRDSDQIKTSTAISQQAAKDAHSGPAKPTPPPEKTLRHFNTVSATPAEPRQGGDTCATAFVIPSLPFSDLGTTCGYTNDYDYACPYSGSTSPDVVYRWDATATETVDISLCANTNYDSKLYVYDGVCSGVPIACNDDSCTTPSFPSPYVSKLTGVSFLAGHTYYIVVDGYGGACGNYTIDITPPPPPPPGLTCPTNSLLFGQNPHLPTDAWSAATSAVGSSFQYKVFENFEGVTGNICDIHWWGLSLFWTGSGWAVCTPPAGETFLVEFWQPGALPTPLVSSYTVTPTILDTTQSYAGYPLYYFSVDALLPCTVGLPAGWVSIQSQPNSASCVFLWMSSPTGDGISYQLDVSTGIYTNTGYNRALCLTGEYVPTFGACCNDATSECLDNVQDINCVGPGMRYAANTLCVNLVPPCGQITGACCRDDGTCDLTTQANCNGNWLGPNTACSQCPCITPCPPEGVPEQEPCGQDTNGGCNMAIPAFEPLVIDETICGTSWCDGSTRDTDWYQIDITQQMQLTLRAKTEFGAVFGFLGQITPGVPGCGNLTGYISPYAVVTPCQETTVVSACLPVGTYYAFMAPYPFVVISCPARYWMRLTGVACTIPTGACCLGDGSCFVDTQAACTGSGGYYWGDSTQCALVYCTGACCHPDGTCTDVPQVACTDTFKGISTQCATIPPCPVQGPGDSCSNPLIVVDPPLPYVNANTTCGRGTLYAGQTCLGSYDQGEQIIYGLYFSQNTCVKITVDGATPNDNWIGAAIDPVCPPPLSGCLAKVTTSGTHAVINNVNLTGGVPYYLMIDTWPAPYCLNFTLTIEACPPAAPCDNCAQACPVGDVTNLPFDTCTATFDGPGGCMQGPNLWYCYTATATAPVLFSLCGSTYDTKLAIYDGCACWGPMLACNDDNGPGCPGLQSSILLNVIAGHQYLLEVGGYSTYCGPGVLTIQPQEPCIVECPPGGVAEQEPCGQDTNGGCNSTPPAFERVECNGTICGTIYTTTSIRDTDWYEVVVTQPSTFTYTVKAEFAVVFGLIEQIVPGVPGCTNITGYINPYALASPCVEASITTAQFPAGTYYFFVSHQDWPDMPCTAMTNNYTATLTTTPPCICGDFNGDGFVNADDYWLFVDAFGHCAPDPKYRADADFDNNGCVDLADYQAWLTCYHNANGKDFVAPGQKVTPPARRPGSVPLIQGNGHSQGAQ